MGTVQDKLKAKEGYRILLLNSPLEQKSIFPDHDKFRIIMTVHIISVL